MGRRDRVGGKAKKLNKEQCVGDCGCCSDLQDDNTCTLIDRVPTVDDAVIVTRCKNCKWFADNNGGEWYGCKMFHVVRITPEDAPKPDDFCSYGERRVDHLALEAKTTQIIDGCCTACGAFMDCIEAADYKFCPYCAKRIVCVSHAEA